MHIMWFYKIELNLRKIFRWKFIRLQSNSRRNVRDHKEKVESHQTDFEDKIEMTSEFSLYDQKWAKARNSKVMILIQFSLWIQKSEEINLRSQNCLLLCCGLIIMQFNWRNWEASLKVYNKIIKDEYMKQLCWIHNALRFG